MFKLRMIFCFNNNDNLYDFKEIALEFENIVILTQKEEQVTLCLGGTGRSGATNPIFLELIDFFWYRTICEILKAYM